MRLLEEFCDDLDSLIRGIRADPYILQEAVIAGVVVWVLLILLLVL